MDTQLSFHLAQSSVSKAQLNLILLVSGTTLTKHDRKQKRSCEEMHFAPMPLFAH